MDIKFTPAEPVKSKGAGRKPAENPFTEIIAEIALKESKPSVPVAMSFTQEFDGTDEGYSKLVEKIRYQTSKAGADNLPPVTVRVAHKREGKKAEFTIWTKARETRKRKDSQ